MINLKKTKSCVNLPLNNKLSGKKDVKLKYRPLYLAVVTTFCLISMPTVMLQSSHASEQSNTYNSVASSSTSGLSDFNSDAIFTTDIQLFNELDNPSADNQAKDLLITALSQYVGRERTTVSQMRYQVTPYVNDDIESNSQSLFRTFIELAAYQYEVYGSSSDDDYYSDSYGDLVSSDEDKQAFRSRDEYLDGNEDKLYIRYDDEINDELPSPDYNVTRKVGMSDDYKERSTAIHYYSYNQDDCVIDYSVALDELIDDNPSLTIDDSQVDSLKDTYSKCTLEAKQEYKTDIENAVGYQATYAPMQDQCAAMYHNNIATLLSPNRRNTKVNYDEYDSVYQSYRICYDVIGDKQELEPNYYINFEKSQETLDFSVAKIECSEALFAKQESLSEDGFTLANSPDKYASIYYNDYSTCVFDAEQNILYATDYETTSVDSSSDDADYKEGQDHDVYDSEDYDSEDYDSEDYDSEDYDSEDYDSEDYDSEDYDSEDYDSEDYDSEDYEHSEKEYASGAEKFKHDLANLDISGFLEDYRNMKAWQEAEGESEADIDDIFDMGSIMGASMFILDFMQRTPEQLQARNYYAYEPLTIRTVSRYQPDKQLYSALYSYDFDTPTFKASVQMPLELDFKQTQLTFDPSAMLPVMAMIAPESTPLPQDMEGKVVTFSLPEGMSDIPIQVLQQSFIDALQEGFAALNPAYFTQMSLQNDDYAKQVGATRGVKVYLGSKQSGELIGKVIKNLTRDLNDYIDAHPDQYPKEHPIRTTIENWSLYNEGFQSKDVGSILQLIEAVAPISFDGFNYFYLDAQGELIAKQSRTEFASYLSQTNYSVIRQSRFDQASFQRAPYSDRLNTLFFTDRDSIDGNEWLETLKQDSKLIHQARYARYEYELPYYDDEYDEIYGNDYAEEIIEEDDDNSKLMSDESVIDEGIESGSVNKVLQTKVDIQISRHKDLQEDNVVNIAATVEESRENAFEPDTETTTTQATTTQATTIVTTTTIAAHNDDEQE